MSLRPAERMKRRATRRASIPRCRYCKTATRLVVIHDVPTCRGGDDSRSNLILACARCAKAKGPLTDLEFRRTAPGDRKQMITAVLHRIERERAS